MNNSPIKFTISGICDYIIVIIYPNKNMGFTFIQAGHFHTAKELALVATREADAEVCRGSPKSVVETWRNSFLQF